MTGQRIQIRLSLWLRMVLCLALLSHFLTPAAAAQTGKLDPVTLQLKWTHAFQFAGYYAALEKGYYREAGLDVTIAEATPGVDPIRKVIDGQAQYGVGTSSLLLERYAGRPVVALAVIFQHSPYVLIARYDNGTQGIHDLVGKRIMLEPQSDEILAYLKEEDVPLDRITRVEHSYDPQDLISGNVDAIAGYVTNQPYYLGRANFKYQVYTPRSAGIDFYGDNLFTTEQELLAHPARAKAFRAASLRGWQYAMEHSEEIVDLIVARYSQRHTRDYFQFEARQMIPLLRPELIEAGYMNPGRWRHIAEVYAELGMMKSDFDLKGFLYDPNPAPPDLRWLYALAGAAAIVAGAVTALAVYVYRINVQLRRDVAARKEAEEALRQAKTAAETATRVKEQFLAKLSHELRTPLTPVLLAAAQWETQADIPAALRDDLAMVRRNLELEARLLEDLLDVNRILYGKLTLRHEVLSVHRVIGEALATVAPNMRAKHLQLSVQLQARNDRVSGDPARVQQILWNLLSNAIKFTPDAGSIAISTTNDPDGQLCVRVSDSGMGIERDVLARLFSPFEQGGAQVNRQYGGMGLGLSICKSMAEAHGGSITATSGGRNKGAAFTVRLPPAHVPAGGGVIVPRDSVHEASSDGRPLRILLVEDHADTARMVSRLLRGKGYAVQTAGDVASARTLLRARNFDLLVSDLGLPDGSGLDLMRQLADDSVPILGIAVSGYGTEDDLCKSREAGFAEHLVKPISFPKLLATIERVAGSRIAEPTLNVLA